MVTVAVLVTAVVAWLAVAPPAAVQPGSERADAPEEVRIERSTADRQLPRVGAPPWRPPARGSWSVLPDAPVGSRVGHVVADPDSAGGGVLVWGGFQSGRPLDTAAIFDIAAGRWQRIANSPAAEDGHVGVTAGPLLILLHARTPMAYDAERDFWQLLPQPELEAGLLVTPVSAFTGRLAVALTATRAGRPGPVVAYDVVTNTWSRLPAPPGRLSSDHELVWDGADLLLLGRTDGRPFGQRLEFGTSNAAPGSGAAWEALPPPPVREEIRSTAAVRAVASGPVRAGHPVYVWLGPRPGGSQELPRLLTYDGGTDAGAWREVARPQLGAAVPELFWSGDELLVVDQRGVGRFDPEEQRFAMLPDAEVAPGQLRGAAWTGTHLVWWGGEVADGAVWRPARAQRTAR